MSTNFAKGTVHSLVSGGLSSAAHQVCQASRGRRLEAAATSLRHTMADFRPPLARPDYFAGLTMRPRNRMLPDRLSRIRNRNG